MENAVTMQTPQKFLKVRIEELSNNPSLRCMCPGFEVKQWRADDLAVHLLDWLPEFALRPEEFGDLSISKVNRLMREAAARLFTKGKSTAMAEVGELLLHACCRQVAGTFPAVSKIYFKSTGNEFVKGFDLVHTKYDDTADKLEIWLGESKFYKDGPSAVTDAIASVSQHLDRGFLKAEKMLVGPKISKATPGYKKMEWMFEPATSIDEIFDVMVLPILVAYDSPAASSWSSDSLYTKAVEAEVLALHKKFAGSTIKNFVVHVFYLPMATKELLVQKFESRLKAYLP